MIFTTRTSRRAIGSLAAATFAVVGLSQVSASASTIKLTEMDYFSTPGQVGVLNGYIKQFNASHPGIKVTRTYVEFADLDQKLLTDAAGHDLPNIMAVDNPFVPTMIQTGEIVPLSGFKGFSAKGYYPAVMNEGYFNGKYYSYGIGANSVALFYNIGMFKAAHLMPPTTWAQLVSDAKALTTAKHFGIAFSAPTTEEATWQFEPFLWTNGGSWANIAGPAGVQALTLWQTLVNQGSASKGVLTWGQTPDVLGQFDSGKAAMMVNGPWNFSGLAQQGWSYGKQYGIVPVPVRSPGQKVVVPLGGEDWMISNSGGSAEQQAAWEFVQGMQQPALQLNFAKNFGYIPPLLSVGKTFLAQAGPSWSVFVNQTLNARPRTLGLGAKYPKISEAVWTAIQAALSGTASVKSALTTAQAAIKSVLGS